MVGMLQSAKPSSPSLFSFTHIPFLFSWTFTHFLYLILDLTPLPFCKRSLFTFSSLIPSLFRAVLLPHDTFSPFNCSFYTPFSFFRVPSHFSFCILFAFPPLFLGGESFNPPPFTLQGLCSLRTLCVWVCGVCACVCECVCVW